MGPNAVHAGRRAKLQDVPIGFRRCQKNRWQMTSAEPMDPPAVALLECAGYIHRVLPEPADGRDRVRFRDHRSRRANFRAYARVSGSRTDYTAATIASLSPSPMPGAGRPVLGTFVRQERAGGSAPRLLRVDRRERAGRPRRDAIRICRPRPYLWISSKPPAKCQPGRTRTNSDTCREFLKDFLPVLRPYLLEPMKE